MGRSQSCELTDEGAETAAAKQAFGEILSNQTLTARQTRFIDTIINFLSVKGIFDAAMIFEPPNRYNHRSINGIV